LGFGATFELFSYFRAKSDVRSYSATPISYNGDEISRVAYLA